jgi:glycosyltransferase involved in cell wall biosynthesis
VLHLAKHIILFTEILIEQWSMQRYKKKVLIADDHYLDLNIYRIVKPLSQRTKTVGYIGRLSNEKGILNYLSAIPMVLQKQPDTRFLVVGNGPLDDKVKKYVVNEHLEQYVKLVARVSPETVPSYLNQLQLCVLPSYTEGMPNIMIEAMACGTPVLATPVGGIPDIIKDNKTGFIMENNLPESIAANICRALDCNYLEKIAQTARLFAEQRFTFEAASQSYKRISKAMIEHM